MVKAEVVASPSTEAIAFWQRLETGSKSAFEEPCELIRRMFIVLNERQSARLPRFYFCVY